MQEQLDQIKIVVALRSARAAVGWSQEELALALGIAKTTLARMETLEGGLRADQLSQIVRLYKSLGVELDFMFSDEIKIKVDRGALEKAQARLLDGELRRVDRKKSAPDSLVARLRETRGLQGAINHQKRKKNEDLS